MKITEHAEQQHQTYTGQASSVARSLALAAVAIVWLFAGGLADDKATPQVLLDELKDEGALWAALLLALVGLALDLAQYFIASLAWGWVHRRLDAVLEGDDGTAPMTAALDADWRKVRAVGLVSALEEAAPSPAAAAQGQPPTWEQRRDAVRRLAHPPGSDPLPAVAAVLNRPAAPGWITILTGLLFAAKLVAVLAAYGALAVFAL